MGMYEISRGRLQKAKKVVIYGPEGIGKSSLAAAFPDPLFIDTEGSTSMLDVARLPAPNSEQMLLDEIDFARRRNLCKTLVIDTADWAEKLIIADLCKSNGWSGLESAGYGKGYTYAEEHMAKLLDRLTECIDAGINVVITAHAWLRKVELPEEMGAYDHWEMKTSKKAAPKIREWADMVLFLNYKTIVVNVDGQGASKGKNKAQGGMRVMYTTHTPFWDAKNRYGLPDELPLNYEAIRHIVEDVSAGTAQEPAPAPVATAPSAAPAQTSAPQGVPAQVPPQMPVGAPETPTVPPNKPFSPAPDPDEGKQLTLKDVAEADLSEPGMEDGIPPQLLSLMQASTISESEIRHIVSAQGYCPYEMPIRNYPPDFVQGALIDNWPNIIAMIQQARSTDTIPFN